jgi:hypothetical protein
MNRRDFVRNIGWSALTAVGMIIAAGSREPVYAGGKKGGRKSGSSKGKSNVASNPSAGGSRKTNNGNKSVAGTGGDNGI